MKRAFVLAFLALAAALALNVFVWSGEAKHPEAASMCAASAAEDAAATTNPCSLPGDQAFNSRFYTVGSGLTAFVSRESVNDVRVLVPKEKKQAELVLVSANGTSTNVVVPEKGCVVIAPDVILVSRAILSLKQKRKLAEQSANSCAVPTTVYSGSSWQRVEMSGCAAEFDWDANENCYISTCEGATGSCSATVTHSGGTTPHSSSCSEGFRTKICGGTLMVF